MNWKYEKERIYSIDENNELLAETTLVYKSESEVDIDHTYVSPLLRGKGVAGQMMKAVAEYLREKSLKATATCSYAYAWFKKHSTEYADIISDDIDNTDVACKIDGRL